MVSDEISKDELRQLLYFMQRVKSFERTFMIQKDSIIKLIWGLLFMGAGILDCVMIDLQFATSAVGIFALLPWLIAMFSGLVIQIFSDRHITNIYNKEVKKETNSVDTLILISGFILIGVVVTIFNANEIYSLTFPLISIISGLMALILDKKNLQKNKDIINRYSYYLTPLITFSAAILMILISLLDSTYFKYHGLLFGICFGSSFLITAIWNRKSVENYIENTEVE